MDRRTALSAAALAIAGGLAGCVGDDDDTADDDDSVTGDESPAEDDSAPEGDDGDNDSTDSETTDIEGLALALTGVVVSGIAPEDEDGIESTVASELDLHEDDVRTDADLGVIEVFAAIDSGELVDALETAGFAVDSEDVGEGVSETTRESARTILSDRLSTLEHENADVRTVGLANEPPHLDVTVPGADEAEILEPVLGRAELEIVLGYPDPDSPDVPVTEVVLERDDLAEISKAQQGGANQQPNVPVRLTEAAGEHFQESLIDAGFTDEGVGNCYFDVDDHIEPQPDQYCIYTRFDSEYTFGASVTASFAETLTNDEFLDDPSFVIQTEEFEQAQAMEANLRTDPLPTTVEMLEDD